MSTNRQSNSRSWSSFLNNRRFETLLILALVIILSIIPFSHRIYPWAAALALILTATAAVRKAFQAMHIGLLTSALTLRPALVSALHAWPLHLLIPLILYFVTALAVPPIRRSLDWLHRGRLGKDVALLFVTTVVLSGIALYVWYRALAPDLSLHLGRIPVMPLWVYPFAGVAFGLGNAAVEEFVFRGVIMQATDTAFSPGTISILLQAWLFGAMHYLYGFPNGTWGVTMASIYGVMLGMIRRRSRGILAPWLAHVCADFVIFAILSAINLGCA